MITYIEGSQKEKKAKVHRCLVCKKKISYKIKYCSDECKISTHKNFKKERIEKNKSELTRLQNERRLIKKADKLRVSIYISFFNYFKYQARDEELESILGYSFEDLKKHLESQFDDYMSWDNWGFYGWHIDHIIPLSRFHIINLEEFNKAWALDNLQPLWAYDNLSKNDKTMEEYLKCQI